MLRILRNACVALGCLGLAGAIAGAQEVVHAMTGTIRSIDAAQKTFTLVQDDGTFVTFKDTTDSKSRIGSDERFLPDATRARASDKKNAYVIVFYYGMAEHPTAVAVEALGSGPFTDTDGTVSSFNEKERSISVKDESGSIHEYKINEATIADSGLGVVGDLRFHPDKGGHVRVVGEVANGSPTAVFLNLM